MLPYPCAINADFHNNVHDNQLYWLVTNQKIYQPNPTLFRLKLMNSLNTSHVVFYFYSLALYIYFIVLIPTILSTSSGRILGAPINKSFASPVLGKAITSLILSSPRIAAIKRSMPKAVPP